MNKPFKSSTSVLARLIASQPKAANPTGEQRRLDANSLETEKIVESVTLQTDAKLAAEDAILGQLESRDPDRFTPDESLLTGDEKRARLVDDDFPFDESQLEAIYGLVQVQYGCLTGPAGTGKTTVLKKLVDMLRDGLQLIDLKNYWRSNSGADPEDEYDEPDSPIPSICLASFTGRAAQQIKSNFPTDWHANIMTIHRMLGFFPEFYDAFDETSGQMRQTMRFVPSYTAENKLPWDIIVIDEAGMCGLDLWHLVWAACKSSTRIFLVGDIQQLPPTHGKSIFGFAMGSWPTWELTHVHRQQGVNNSIVDNAHRILKGQRPISDSPKPLQLKDKQSAIETLKFMLTDKDWRFLTVAVDDASAKAGAYIREMLKLLKNAKFYDPNRDAVITAINGYDSGQTGAALGQEPMNRELSMILNPDEPRWIIDAGRERRNFAVGDKVMATKNDWEAGITNGMTGIVTSIVEHGEYTGDKFAFGRQDLVDAYLDELDDDEDHSNLSVEDFNLESQDIGKHSGEKRDAGPASHIVTVRFGEGDSAFEMTFSTKSEVGTIQLAYVVTCHKMQGGEAPLVFLIVHLSHKRMLTREWFYTGVTRASGRCVVLFTRDGMGNAIGKQTIKGKTLADKVRSFQELQKIGIAGASVTVKMPRPHLMTQDESLPSLRQPEPPTVSEPSTNEKEQVRVEVVERVVVRDRVIILEKESNHGQSVSATIDGGEITPHNQGAVPVESGAVLGRPPAQLERPSRLAKPASTLGAIRAMLRIEDVRATRLLPAPIEVPGAGGGMPDQPVKVQAKPKSLAALLGKKKES